MGYSYTPTYYSTLHDSITSLCKTILPLSLKKKRPRLASAEHRLSRLQTDNLKWQQDSFHRILNLIGLHKEGILAEREVSTFRTHLLETLIASPPEHEQAVILRDKLVFLQELLYAKCISEEEYHSSKRPLLQRLAIQGAEIEARDVVVAASKDFEDINNHNNNNTNNITIEEEWSEIDLKDDKLSTVETKNTKTKCKSAIKQQIKGAASVFGFTSHKQSTNREGKSIFEIEAKRMSLINDGNEKENPPSHCQLKDKESESKSSVKQESLPNEPVKDAGSTEKLKRKPFKSLFNREHNSLNYEEKVMRSEKKQWGLEGFKKWKRHDSDDETTPLPLKNERSDSEAYSGSCHLVTSPIGEGPDTKQIKKKLHANGSSSDFFIDKVLGANIKRELSRIQAELCTTNPSLRFSDDQIEAISTKLPVDKADLKKFFPKSWCDRYGDVVLDVVKKEFKDHVGEMENLRNAYREKPGNNSAPWTTFDDCDDENYHLNLYARQDDYSFTKKLDGKDQAYTNPFLHTTYPEQNPFWRVA